VIIRELLQTAKRTLKGCSDTPRTDAFILLTHILEKTPSQLITCADDRVSASQEATVNALLARRVGGEPIAYLTGEAEFWSLPLAVNHHVLVPRADTECLVEQVLARFGNEKPMRVCDLGTGSGAIALAIGHERPHWQITAVDQSIDALSLAKSNATHLALSHIRFIQGDWCEPLRSQSIDILVANPPYICADDPHLHGDGVRFEPKATLVAKDNGLADIETICASGKRVLAPGGRLFLEHGYDQQAEVARILHKLDYRSVKMWQDLNSNPRLISASIPS